MKHILSIFLFVILLLPSFTHAAYDPTVGIWLSRDPIGEDGGLNLYSYSYNNPLNWIDPLGLKPGDPYPSANAAAIQAISDINATSDQQQVEYAGQIYQNPDGTYSYTPPHTLNPPSPVHSSPGSCPAGTNQVAPYHTHPPIPGYDSNNFSPKDIANADAANKPSYLGTPSGDVKEYTPGPGGGTTQTIGTTPSYTPSRRP